MLLWRKGKGRYVIKPLINHIWTLEGDLTPATCHFPNLLAISSEETKKNVFWITLATSAIRKSSELFK